ncbi:MAG: hypothetical protein WBV55_02265 [Candidatus Sulfotelmatobacter sp.]
MACAALLAVLGTSSIEAQGGGRAQAQGEVAYQSTVESYSKTLKPGMSRKEVESNLRSKKARFQQTCCFEGRRTPDDLVKIGQESAPWYCNRTDVYVAFEFAGEERHPSSQARDSDKLERVSLLRWPQDCL